MSDCKHTGHVIDLRKEPLPRHFKFGTATIDGRAFELVMAYQADHNAPAVPMVIEPIRELAWIGCWEFLIESAAVAINKVSPLH